MNLISKFEQLQKLKNENRKKEEILENKIMRAMKKAVRIVRIKQEEEQALREQQEEQAQRQQQEEQALREQQEEQEQAQRQQQEEQALREQQEEQEQAQKQQEQEQEQAPRKDFVRTTRRPIKETHPTNEQIVIMTQEYSKEQLSELHNRGEITSVDTLRIVGCQMNHRFPEGWKFKDFYNIFMSVFEKTVWIHKLTQPQKRISYLFYHMSPSSEQYDDNYPPSFIANSYKRGYYAYN